MELFTIGFLSISLIDVIDIAIVSYLFYRLFEFIKGTISARVIAFIFSVFVIWKIVDFLKFPLLSSILSQILGLGTLAFVILFTPEIRKLLTHFSNRFNVQRVFNIVLPPIEQEDQIPFISMLVATLLELQRMSEGALIVIKKQDELKEFVQTGEKIDARCTQRLLLTIFQKASPLHDGAVIIKNGRIESAHCILPISEMVNLPPNLGTRHRAAIGISEISDALTIVVSEERGAISYCLNGLLHQDCNTEEIMQTLIRFLKV